MSGPILEARDLKVSRGGTPVLDVREFTLNPGEFLSVIGPNGSGKSTLLLSLAGLLELGSGELRFGGVKIAGGRGMLEYRRRIAMVFQEPLLFDSTVYANVASGLAIRGMGRHETRDRVRENLELFGIAHLSDRSARKLSGGEAQRTSLARAFATQPEIVFMDEPFSSLDPPTKESIVEDLSRVIRLRRTCVVMATHDRVDALTLSDRIAVMDGGSVVQAGTPSEVMYRPVSEAVAAFVGIENMVRGVVTGVAGGMLEVQAGRARIRALGAFPRGEEVVCLVRPESVTLSTPGTHEESSARNVLHGRVVRVRNRGDVQGVFIDCGFPLVASVTKNALEELCIEEGREVTALFKATAVHVVKSARAYSGGQNT